MSSSNRAFCGGSLLFSSNVPWSDIKDLCLLDTTVHENHLVSAVGLAIGVTIGTVCSTILETVDTLWSRGSVDSTLLVSTLGTQSVGLSTVLGVVVDDRLAGDVLGLGLALNRLGVRGVTSVAGVDKGLESGTLARVRLHDLLVLTESLGHLLVADVVQELALTERSWNGSTELTVTSLHT